MTTVPTAIGSNLAEGTAIIRMEADVDELIDSTGKTLNELKKRMKRPAGAYHLVHCGGRRAGIDGRIDEVARQIKEAAGDIAVYQWNSLLVNMVSKQMV